MGRFTIIAVPLEETTHAVLSEVALSWNMSLSAACSNILYRDAAQMSGWPGQLGMTLRHILEDQVTVKSGVAELLPFDYPAHE